MLAPVVQTVRAGVTWENYELVQEFEAPDGVVHRMLVRAVVVPDTAAVSVPRHRRRRLGARRRRRGSPPTSAERLTLLVEHSPDAIIVHQDGLVVYTNPAGLRMGGVKSLDDAIGRPITSFISPDDLTSTIARLAQLKDPGDVVKGFEAMMVRDDGSELPVEVASARTSWGGKPAFQVILRDVSERKLAEEAAAARAAIERRYAAAVAALEEGVVVIDREGAVAATNDSATRILGGRLHAGHGDEVFTGGDAPCARTVRRSHPRPCRWRWPSPGARRPPTSSSACATSTARTSGCR